MNERIKRIIYAVKLKLAMNMDKAMNILKVSPNEVKNPDILKKKYRELVKKNHPDVGGSTEKMQDINSAYDYIKDKDKPRKVSPKYKEEPDEDTKKWRDIFRRQKKKRKEKREKKRKDEINDYVKRAIIHEIRYGVPNINEELADFLKSIAPNTKVDYTKTLSTGPNQYTVKSIVHPKNIELIIKLNFNVKDYKAIKYEYGWGIFAVNFDFETFINNKKIESFKTEENLYMQEGAYDKNDLFDDAFKFFPKKDLKEIFKGEEKFEDIKKELDSVLDSWDRGFARDYKFESNNTDILKKIEDYLKEHDLRYNRTPHSIEIDDYDYFKRHKK